MSHHESGCTPPTIIPNLPFTGKSCAAAIDWYQQVFGAITIMRMPAAPTGEIPHASLEIGHGQVMLHDLSDQFTMPGMPGWGAQRLYVHFEDVDAIYQSAVDNGATGIMPPADMFWGDRLGVIVDPFGHCWSLAKVNQKLNEAEILEAMKAAHAPA